MNNLFWYISFILTQSNPNHNPLLSVTLYALYAIQSSLIRMKKWHLWLLQTNRRMAMGKRRVRIQWMLHRWPVNRRQVIFLQELSIQNIPLHYILLSFSLSSPPPTPPLSHLLPYTHVYNSMVLQDAAQVQRAPSNWLGQTPSTHDNSVELYRVCPCFALCLALSSVFYLLPSVLCFLSSIYYILSAPWEPVTVVCISHVLITTMETSE